MFCHAFSLSTEASNVNENIETEERTGHVIEVVKVPRDGATDGSSETGIVRRQKFSDMRPRE